MSGIELRCLKFSNTYFFNANFEGANFKKVEFDKLNYHLTFQNKIKLDIRTGEVTNIMREDYIETLLAYDYYEPAEEDYEEFVKAFESCFMDETYTDLELEEDQEKMRILTILVPQRIIEPPIKN